MSLNDYIGKTLKPWPILVDHYTPQKQEHDTVMDFVVISFSNPIELTFVDKIESEPHILKEV
ncbi:hypothetical protein VR7878_00375 [Vibrio ruber DSM 16370]|uniref:Uncharacterized protein n=1 Tax=Vibrio ruber (strain DSM 16370 / JCM 11486 / BCRC 17186 / CECT 7878 / LMG 23124 / VR1) TaxID=1123498 RepID=A0A1R4LAY6_VIBR1|nr:hypothetical protein VR7878_00375 [Vibrio ruber DSM 16370]